MGVAPTGPRTQGSTRAALEAFSRGYVAVPIRDGGKKPYGVSWIHTRWTSEEEIREAFERYAGSGAHGVGLLLGEPSGGLVDVDLDHPKALRLRDYLLPASPMNSGRVGRPRSHRWYRVTEGLPATRQYRTPERQMLVELRSTGAQTVIPPSTWYPSQWKEGDPTQTYRWEGPAWGGPQGPAVVDGRKLGVQVGTLAIGALLLDNWPRRGGRHEAYLALAGGLLRFGDGVHPWWEKALPALIEAMADATDDEDGGKARVAETMKTTLGRLQRGQKAIGFPRLAELIGVDPAEQVRRWAKDVEALSGFVGTPIRRLDSSVPVVDGDGLAQPELAGDDGPLVSTLPPEERNPLEERISSWGVVDLGPYLSGQVVMPPPTIMVREDGAGLMYPGRVNSLFGASESAKSWMAVYVCLQEMAEGNRVAYFDLEDSPEGTLGRMLALGGSQDDINEQFRYIHPEGPLAEMQRYRFGPHPTEEGRASSSVLDSWLSTFDPTLIIIDTMNVLYGLHGHDTNDASSTDVITSWLKRLCRAGRTTVIVLDHTGKSAGPGSSPLGAHHKVAMVQGVSLRIDVIDRPRKGALGMMKLIVHKDRPGAVRAISTDDTEQVAGTVILDSTQEGITRMRIDVPDPNDVTIGATDAMDRKMGTLERVGKLEAVAMRLFEEAPDGRLTTAEVAEETSATKPEVRGMWEYLIKNGRVRAYGEGRGRYYVRTVLPGGDIDDLVK